jgi:hypothetical protein
MQGTCRGGSRPRPAGVPTSDHRVQEPDASSQFQSGRRAGGAPVPLTHAVGAGVRAGRRARLLQPSCAP